MPPEDRLSVEGRGIRELPPDGETLEPRELVVRTLGGRRLRRVFRGDLVAPRFGSPVRPLASPAIGPLGSGGGVNVVSATLRVGHGGLPAGLVSIVARPGAKRRGRGPG